MDNSDTRRLICGTLRGVTALRIQPNALEAQANAYGTVVRRIEDATDELLLTISLCAGALGDVTEELDSAVRYGLAVLAHDHRQLQQGLHLVATCFRDLDQTLFR